MIYAPTIEKLNDPYEGLNEPIILRQLEVLGPYAEKVIQSFKEVFAKKSTLGIYSLSVSENDELLWAHYANSHRGFCFELDLYYLLDLYVDNESKINFASILNVDYLSKPPIISINDIDYSDFERMFKKIIGTKSEKWSYEKEIRILYEKSGEVPIDYRAIKSVIFGIRSDDKYIEKFINTFPFKINVYKARMTNRYKIEKDYIGETNGIFSSTLAKDTDLWVDDSDIDYKKYRVLLDDAVEYVRNEPYIEDVFFVGINRDRVKDKILIKVNATRDRKVSPWPVKAFYFDIVGNKISLLKLL